MKAFYVSRGHTKRGLSLLFALFFFLFSLSIQAQDVPTEEPAPAEATTQPVPDVLPTEIPTLIPTIEPAPITPEPITPEPTAEATLAPAPATLEPTAEATIAASPEAPVLDTVAFPLLYSATFESSDTPGLSNKNGWTEVLVEGGKALQAGVDAQPVAHRMMLSEGAAEARFWLVSGEGQVQFGNYRAALAADGTVTLARDQVAVSSINVTLAPDTWALLRLQVIGSQIRISVNNVLVIDYTDAMPLPAGQAGFSASSGAVLRVDDFAIYGVASATQQPGEVLSVGEPMDMPTNLQATVNGSAITLTWVDNASAETGYEIQSQPFTITSVSANATTYTLSNVGCGLTVWFRVRAVQGGAPGEWSAFINASTAPCSSMCMPFSPDPRVNIGSNNQYQSADGLNSVAGGLNTPQYNQTIINAVLSQDGRYVLFSSSQPLTTPNTNELASESAWVNDVYRYDTEDFNCPLVKVSLDETGGETLAPMMVGTLSDDGTKAIFVTDSVTNISLAIPEMSRVYLRPKILRVFFDGILDSIVYVGFGCSGT